MISTLAAFMGVLVSVFLTLIKFRSSFHCDSAYLTACSDSCSRVLTSEYSTIAGVPISIYSASFFLVMLGLSWALLWRPKQFAAVARPLLLALSAASLLVIALLSINALFFVGGLCYYCIVIYGLVTVTAIGVSLTQEETYRTSLRQLFTWKVAKTATLRNALLSLIAASLVQQLLYRSAAQSTTGDERCIVLGHLPKTSIESPEQPTRALIALFIDMSCEHCRREFTKVLDYSRKMPEIKIAVYHYARSGECIPATSDKFNRYSESTQSCQAARAAVCAETLKPGAGLRMVEQLFLLQDSPPLSFGDKLKLADAARAAEVPGIPDDFKDASAEAIPFFDCLENSSVVSNELLNHASFAAHRQILELPAMFIMPYEDGRPLPTMYSVKGNKESSVGELLSQAEEAIDAMQTGAEAFNEAI